MAHSVVKAALEIGAAQFDCVKTALARRVERGRKRRRVDRPHMQSEPPEFLRHYLYAPCLETRRPRICGQSCNQDRNTTAIVPLYAVRSRRAPAGCQLSLRLRAMAAPCWPWCAAL